MIDPSSIFLLLVLGGLLVLVAVLVSSVSARLGLPVLLIFLAVGMLAGEDGPGAIQFDNVPLAFLVGNLSLAIILLDGGLRTRLETVRAGIAPATALATVGVAITAGLTGAFAALVLDLDWVTGMLLGAIVGSTDAAAVFSILRTSGARLNDRLGATLEMESGGNDPMAVFLTITLIGWLMGEHSGGFADLAYSFVQQFGLGLVGGLAGGWLTSLLVERARLSEGLYALLITSAGVLVFAAINAIGGSGFLAVYLAGIMVGSRRLHADENVLRVMDGFAWLSQAGMFLLLGLLATPRDLLQIAWPAFAVSVFLILVARPVAVLLCVAPFRLPRRETAFLSWVGLRGAVPIVLALFPLMAGVEYAGLLFDVAFFVVLTSLLLQGSTVPWVARRLRVVLPPRVEPLSRSVVARTRAEGSWEVVQFDVAAHSRMAQRGLDEVQWPAGVHVSAVFRDGRPVADAAARMAPGDRLVITTPSERVDELAALFTEPAAAGRLVERRFFGDFTLHGDARLADLAGQYPLQADPAILDLTLADLFHQRCHPQPVAGDEIALGPVVLVAREVREGRVTAVGLRLVSQGRGDSDG